MQYRDKRQKNKPHQTVEKNNEKLLHTITHLSQL